MPDDGRIGFRPLTFDDLPLMHRWLNTDFVARWWHERLSPDEVREKYAARITGEDPTRGFIIVLGDRPVGFIQCYRDVADAPHFRALLDEPERAAGIDLFIGSRDDAYRGLGPRIIRGFLIDIVFAVTETSVCIIDPAQTNRAAIRAYQKIGFHDLATVHAPGELEPSRVMMIRREEMHRDD